MEFFDQMIHLQLTLFLLIVVGVILRKIGIITEQGQKTLSGLTVNLILPCNIVQSFRGDIKPSKELLTECVLAFVFSLGIQLFGIFIARYLFPKEAKDDKKVLSYGVIVSNSSFIGIPIISNLYSDLGVLYTSIFQIPVRLTMWTAGLSLFTKVEKKEAYKKLIKHPCIIAIFIGLLFMAFPIKLPIFMENTLVGISKCMVPISMLAIGSMMSDSKINDLLAPSILYYCLIRLILFPMLVLGVMKLLRIDTMMTGITVLLTAMPMASTTAILADKYDANSQLASRAIFTSTMLSIVTLPVFSFLI